MQKNYTILFALFCVFQACTSNSSETYQRERNNNLSVRNQIVVFDTDSVLIGKFPRLYMLGEFLAICDYTSLDFQVHLYSRNQLNYIKSVAQRGDGPNEINRIGTLVFDESINHFYVSDHGKQKIFGYNVDSVLLQDNYEHYTKSSLKDKEFPDNYFYINDSLSYARIILPTGNLGFNEMLAKWNLSNGETTPLYNHPKIEKRRVNFTVSPENNLYVECYNYHDLLTICDLNGNLIKNIYGPKWDDKPTNKIVHFAKVIIVNDKIVAAYAGGENHTSDEYANKLLVFSLNGDYIKTLDVGYRILDMCLDRAANRLIFSFNDVVQFGYLNLSDPMLNK